MKTQKSSSKCLLIKQQLMAAKRRRKKLNQIQLFKQSKLTEKERKVKQLLSLEQVPDQLLSKRDQQLTNKLLILNSKKQLVSPLKIRFC